MRVRWNNVWVIFRREVRDQVRDRRTLFMIFVLPILLYPMLCIGVVQFSTSFEQKPRTILVIGAEHLPQKPLLLTPKHDGFDPELFETIADAERLKVRVQKSEGRWLDPAYRREAVRAGQADAILPIPADLRERLDTIESEQLPISYSSTDERSQIAYLRLKEVLSRWKEAVVTSRRERDKLPPSYTNPFQIKAEDAASESEQGVNVWAKLFPFLLVMMSLTGAFYPAIDLCAGEKERGTMETLLISPASRAEIVLGKFFTVVLASMMSALLNIISMGLTGVQLARQVGVMKQADPDQLSAALAPPSLTAALWMILLLIPLAVFFSAVCLALAVLARSMKEGQYYMTPLYLVCLPLIFLTLAPGIELTLFYSLVPVTGVSLLLRALILGDYTTAGRFFLPVLVPTVVYGAVALRWAIDQFQREDVLFREAERFDLRVWVRHLLRDKEPTPNGGETLFCFALMLTLAWFMIQYLATNPAAANSIGALAGGQVAFILTPPLAMAVLLTSSPRRTLRLYWPQPRYLALGVALALTLNPLVNELRPIVEWLFPISQAVEESVGQMMKRMPSVGMAIMLFAAVPAVCEELAFRGFILTGLERGHRIRSAILLSALLFGFMHVLVSLFQQLFNATLLGLVLGLLAVRSRSILPGILFHFINNALGVVMAAVGGDQAHRWIAAWLYREPAGQLYHWWWVALGALVSAVLLAWLWQTGSKESLRNTGCEALEELAVST
jgi:sodium transport system permease protein